MHRRSSPARPLVVAAGIATLAACHDVAAPADASPPEVVSLAAIPVPPVGAIDIRGVVIHSTAQGAPLGTVAGARIAISRVDVDPGATDTATARKTLTPVGVVTSGADGAFELRDVGRGYFALDVEPAAGSGLKAGRAWSVSS